MVKMSGEQQRRRWRSKAAQRNHGARSRFWRGSSSYRQSPEHRAPSYIGIPRHQQRQPMRRRMTSNRCGTRIRRWQEQRGGHKTKALRTRVAKKQWAGGRSDNRQRPARMMGPRGMRKVGYV
jgi:hypothetical protein